MHAAPGTELARTGILHRLEELRIELNSAAIGQYGLLTRLKAISEYGGYLYFLTNPESIALASTTECGDYVTIFRQACDAFNEDFGTESTLYHSLLLHSDSIQDVNSFNLYVASSLYAVDVIPYLTTLYAEIQTNYSTSDAASFKKDYGVICETLHRMIYGLQVLQSDLDSLAPDGLYLVNLGYTDSLNQLIQDYGDVYDYGGALQSVVDIANGAISVKLGSYVIENFATVTVGSKGVEIPENPQLSLAYLAMVASSSVYTPMESYTGDPEFIAALKSLTSDDDVAEELVRLYNCAKSYKKPLYKRSLDSQGKPTGPAKIITMKKFFDDIQNGNTGALCTVNGTFMEVDGSWVYALLSRTDSMVDFQNSMESAVDDADYSPTSTQTIDVNGSSKGVTKSETRGGFLNKIQPLHGMVFASSVSTDDNSAQSGSSNDQEEINKLLAQLQDRLGIYGSSVDSKEYAKDTITTDESLTDALFLYGAKYSREADNLTTLLMNNIICSTANLSSVSNYENGYLYVNAFGDIVTADDLVVFPGACNPLIYSEDVDYNLFTVAFMNSYPSILQNTSYFKVASRADIGKYLILSGYDAVTGVADGYKATKIDSIQGVKSTAPISVPNLQLSFSANKGLDTMKVFATRRLIFGDTDHWNEKNQFWSYIPLVNATAMTVDNQNAFPYVRDEDDEYTIACAIAANAYDALTIDEESSEVGNQNRLNDNYVLNYFIIGGLNGTLNATGYEDNVALSYKQFTESSGERRIQALETTSKNLFENATGVDGVIGIKNTSQDPLYGRIFQLLKDYWWVCLIIITLVILYAFTKIHLDLLQAFLTFTFCMFVVYAFVWLIPSVFPSIYNSITNNLAQNLSYEILGVKAEYADAHEMSVSGLSDDSGLGTTSITLYRVPSSQVQDFRDSLGAEKNDLVAGNSISINAEAGIFAEGDAIKVNTGILFNTLKIVGDTDEATASYQLHSVKTVSSNVDYYVPYYEILDCFIEKLNTLSGIYAIPRQTTLYANGKNKDNYLVYSYVNSKPFLTPGDYGLSIPGSELDWTKEELAAYQSQGVSLETTLTNAFGKNADWLGISSMLYNLTDAEKKTLWAHTLQNNGYYDESWVVNNDKMDELITYVNYQTRRFVYDMDSQIGKLSDDVMIKLISMRALIALTQEASEFTNWMYPFTLNYEELTLGDVLNCVFIDDYSKFIGLDMDVVSFVLEEHGWLHLVVFDVLVLLMFVLTHVIHFLVPTLYLLLGFLLVLKIIRLGNVKSVFKGYVKTAFLLFMCSALFTLSIVVARKMNGSIINLYFLLAVMLLILYVVVTIITSVILNFTEFGNDVLTARLTAPLNHMKNSVKNTNLISSRTLLSPKFGKKQKRIERTAYDFDSSVDDLYDDTSYDYTVISRSEPLEVEDLLSEDDNLLSDFSEVERLDNDENTLQEKDL